MRGHGTEAPGSCALLLEKRPGTFSCAGCAQPLFKSKVKFESGTGWPSFNDPIDGAVETSTDRSYGMVRTEVHCANCGSHLGHVFDDGLGVVVGFLFLSTIAIIGLDVASVNRPEPHSGEARIGFETSRFRTTEYHREGFFCDRGPHLLQKFF